MRRSAGVIANKYCRSVASMPECWDQAKAWPAGFSNVLTTHGMTYKDKKHQRWTMKVEQAPSAWLCLGLVLCWCMPWLFAEMCAQVQLQYRLGSKQKNDQQKTLKALQIMTWTKNTYLQQNSILSSKCILKRRRVQKTQIQTKSVIFNNNLKN